MRKIFGIASKETNLENRKPPDQDSQNSSEKLAGNQTAKALT
jgi:hypothetical protein